MEDDYASCLDQNNEFERADDSFNDYENNHDNDQIENEVVADVIVDKLSIQQRINLLNPRQKQVVDTVIKHIKEKSSSNILKVLHGAGGSGKFFVAEIIKDLVNLYSNDPNNPDKQNH
jgi:hypothetical protein